MKKCQLGVGPCRITIIAIFILYSENSPNLTCYITLSVRNINGQSIVHSLCSSLYVMIKSPRNSINETTMIFLGGELNAPKRQAQGHLKDVLHDFAHE